LGDGGIAPGGGRQSDRDAGRRAWQFGSRV
jgi:hypothetical protein